MTATDGPFTEAKEMLGGFNLIEARDMDEAIRIAAEFPWARTGCVEIRPVKTSPRCGAGSELRVSRRRRRSLESSPGIGRRRWTTTWRACRARR